MYNFAFVVKRKLIMKTELEKCLSGEWYDCHAPVFIEFKTKTHKLLLEYNALPYDAKEKKYAILKDMFENIENKSNLSKIVYIMI